MPLHVSSTMCSSSGGQNYIIQHLVSSHSVGGRPVHRLREDCSHLLKFSFNFINSLLSLIFFMGAVSLQNPMVDINSLPPPTF